MIDIYPYQTQAVRDLAWAIFSPNLIRVATGPDAPAAVHDCHFELTHTRRLWLEQLDRDSAALLAHLSQRSSHRLGLYFEQLWHFFLDTDPEVELVAHNLPVRDEGRTLGEFDVIYFCHRRYRHIHLELAVKFYLGVGNGTPENLWPGPDRRDNLYNKLTHLLNKQIRLGEQPRASVLLQEHGIAELHREISLKGYLFQPHQQPLSWPLGYDLERPYSKWAHLGQLGDLLLNLQETHAILLPKMQWLSQAQIDQASNLLPMAELASAVAAHLLEKPYPVLIAALDAHGNEGCRFFVAPDNWPNEPAELPRPKIANPGQIQQ